jgi:hypothetical protein
MVKKAILIILGIASVTGFAAAQDSDYGAVDNFFMANPDLPDVSNYAGRLVNPHYLLIDWDKQSEMDSRMISNGFVRLGVSSWENHNPYGGVPERDLAIAYARFLGADIVVYTSKSGYDADYGAPKNDHNVWFYAKPHDDARRAAPANAAIPSNAEASAAMNRLQDAYGRPRVKGGVRYDATTDTFHWIGPKFGRPMSEPRSQFLSEIGPFLN